MKSREALSNLLSLALVEVYVKCEEQGGFAEFVKSSFGSGVCEEQGALSSLLSRALVEVYVKIRFMPRH